MNRALGHLCAHIGQTGPGEPPEDGEMIEMTLSSRHRIRNSSPGGLRPSTLPLGHGGSSQYWLSHVDVEETFFKPPRPGTEPRTLAWKAAVLTTTLGHRPDVKVKVNWKLCLMLHDCDWMLSQDQWRCLNSQLQVFTCTYRVIFPHSDSQRCRVRIPLGLDACHYSCASMQWSELFKDLKSAVLPMVLCTVKKPLKYFW